MITIEVTVNGANVIVPFHLIIDSKNKPDYMLVIRDKSFKLDVPLHDGKHSIYVNGKNPEDATTTIIISKNGVKISKKVYSTPSAIFYAYNLTI